MSDVESGKLDIETKDVVEMMIGTTSGVCAGFFGTRIGIFVAFAIYAGFVLFQIATYNGAFTVNTTKLENYSDRAEKKVAEEGPGWLESIGNFAVDNVFLTVSFLGGAIIGIAYA